MATRKPDSPLPSTTAIAPADRVVALARDESKSGAPLTATPDGVALIREWAASGASNNWIATHLGISRMTFREIRKRQPEVDEALEDGRAIDEHEVANVLRGKALAGDTVAMLFYLKARHGWREGDTRDGGTGQVNVQVIQLAAPMTPEQYGAMVAADERAQGGVRDQDSADDDPPTTDPPAESA